MELAVAASDATPGVPFWESSEDSALAEPGRRASLAEASRLRALFDAHYANVWRLLRRFGVAEAQVDDAAQEVFCVIARRLGDVRVGSEKSFLYGVAIRIAADHHRRRRAAPEHAHPLELEEVADPGPSPEACLEERRARELLDVVMDRLPLKLRTVFVLAEIEGMEVRHIAEVEGIPVGTAASRLRLAREEFSATARRLRALLVRKGGIR